MGKGLALEVPDGFSLPRRATYTKVVSPCLDRYRLTHKILSRDDQEKLDGFSGLGRLIDVSGDICFRFSASPP